MIWLHDKVLCLCFGEIFILTTLKIRKKLNNYQEVYEESLYSQIVDFLKNISGIKARMEGASNLMHPKFRRRIDHTFWTQDAFSLETRAEPTQWLERLVLWKCTLFVLYFSVGLHLKTWACSLGYFLKTFYAGKSDNFILSKVFSKCTVLEI